MLGIKILERKPESTRQMIDLSHQTRGTYFIRIRRSGNVLIKKVIIVDSDW
ncbi:hypothetical protein ACFLTA_06740 [Bacteroidota bacterium]